MLRPTLFIAATALAGCQQATTPTPHADGAIVTHAVEQAQAKADQRRQASKQVEVANLEIGL
ncbi:MAG: hypothetical protein ACXWUP_07510 [Allosphingosinicella sp.]